MFDDIQRFTKRLEILMEHEPMHPKLRKEVINTMTVILKFIGVVEKAIKDGRTGTSWCSVAGYPAL